MKPSERIRATEAKSSTEQILLLAFEHNGASGALAAIATRLDELHAENEALRERVSALERKRRSIRL